MAPCVGDCQSRYGHLAGSASDFVFFGRGRVAMVNVEDQPWQRLLIRRMSRDNPVHPGNYIRGKSARLRSGKVVRSRTESFRWLKVVQSGRIAAERLLAFMERHAEYLNVTETDERCGCSS